MEHYNLHGLSPEMSIGIPCYEKNPKGLKPMI